MSTHFSGSQLSTCTGWLPHATVTANWSATDTSSDLWACSPLCSMFWILAISSTFDKSLFLMQILLDHPSELCWPALRTRTSQRCWQSDSATSATISLSTASPRWKSFSSRVPQSPFSSFFRWAGPCTRRTRGSSPSSSASTWWSTSSSSRPRTLISWWPR